MKENLNCRPPSQSAAATSGTSHLGNESSAWIPQTAPPQVDEIIPSAPTLYDESSTGAFTTPVDPSSAGAVSTDDATAPSVLPDPVEVPPVPMQTSTAEPVSSF